MARFAVGQMVETREPIIEVDPGMALGRHRFQLVVVNEANVRSVPAVAIVEITRGIVDRSPDPAPDLVRVAAPAISRAAPRAATPVKTATLVKTATPVKTAKPVKATKPRPKKK